jgi:hypothetical protein
VQHRNTVAASRASASSLRCWRATSVAGSGDRAVENPDQKMRRSS